MYHAGTPKAVKQHISKNLSSDEGHIRILIATIAFGMGIDCKQVNRIIHFGPSKNIECYIQESGRAGREGSQSECILLFNGLLSSHCSQDVKDLLHAESGCRRELIMKTFGFTPAVGIKYKHTCCDKCAEKCSCGEEDCQLGLGLKFHDGTISVNETPRQARPVSRDQKKLLERKLKSFRDNLIREHKEKVLNTVSLPTSLLLEFGKLQILSKIKNCHKIFSISDVMQYVEVWRKSHAFGILTAINDVFNDISDIAVSESLAESDEIIGDMDWEEAAEKQYAINQH
jgi:superfamily II DNA/RNA helicase